MKIKIIGVCFYIAFMCLCSFMMGLNICHTTCIGTVMDKPPLDCVLRVEAVARDGSFIGLIDGNRKYYQKIQGLNVDCTYWFGKDGKFLQMTPENAIMQQ